MGTSNKRPLELASDARIQEMFHPHSAKGPKAGYPLYQIRHELSKVPIQNVSNFVNIPTLMQQLQKTPAIGALLKRNPQLGRSFEQSVWNAVRERGIKGSKYWASAPKEYIDTIANAARGRPNAMNDRVGEMARRFFGDTLKPRTILDIGTFAGGTITGAVKGFTPAQRPQLKIVLVDVNGKVVRNYAVPALVELGVPRKNITVLPTSFYSAAVAYRQMVRPLHERGERRFEKEFNSLIGKVDMVTAGAATINFANDTSPLLRSIKKMLKPGGVLVDWDWGSAEVRSPTVNVPELKRKIIARTADGQAVTEFDAYVSFLNFWMGQGPKQYFSYPEHVKEKLWEDIEKSQNFNFFDWCEQHRDWMEQEREKEFPGYRLTDPAGFRNRAYRDGRSMSIEATRYGLHVHTLDYPFAKSGVKDTGNVNWMMVAQK